MNDWFFAVGALVTSLAAAIGALDATDRGRRWLRRLGLHSTRDRDTTD